MANTPPVVTASNRTIRPNQSLAGSSLFSVTDADNNPITQYQFWDGGAGGGYFAINGAQQGSQQNIDVTAANLGAVTYVGGATSGSETTWVRAFDGTDWSAWVSWTMATTNQAPVATAGNNTIQVNQAVAASSLFSVSDPDGDPITQYRFWDGGAGGGYFAINGAQQGAQQNITVSAANLSQVTYVGGSTGGTETEWVQAFDGAEWGPWRSWTMQTIRPNNAPTIASTSRTLAPNEWVRASDLISASDPDGDPIVTYFFKDITPQAGSGYIWVAGATPPAGDLITVSAADLSSVWFRGGTTASLDDMQVRAFDSFGGVSNWADISLLTTAPNSPPVAAAADASVRPNQAVAASTLFTVSDPNNDAITQYHFWDGGTAGGYFAVNGAQQAAQQNITVNAANLGSVTYVGGASAGSEKAWVQAFDGHDWGAWVSWTMVTANQGPNASAANGTVRPNQAVAASSLFSVSDPDGDAIQQYRFWDGGAGGGYFAVNGAQQASQQNITVSAANLGTVTYVGGASAGSETEWVQAYDGFDWGPWRSWTMSTVNQAPVANAANGSVATNQAVAAATLFSASDPDGDAIQQYRFWDGGAGGGYFAINGAQQAAQQNVTVAAANLGSVTYVGGAAPGSETEWVQVFDGFDWSAWRSWTMTTVAAGGNSVGSAQQVTVGTVASPTVVNNNVGITDSADYYAFTLPSTQNLHLNLTGNNADLSLQLLNADGSQTLATSNQAGAAPESINQTMAAGSYLALVTPVGAAQSSYNLAFSQG